MNQNPTISGRPRWKKVFALSFLCLVISAGTSAVGVFFHAGARWADFWKRHQARQAAIDGNAGARPPIYGDVQTGNAWDHYRQSILAIPLEELESASQSLRDLLQKMAAGTSTERDRDKLRAVLSRLEPVLECLRDGARCERAAYTLSWCDGTTAGFYVWLSADSDAELLCNSALGRMLQLQRDETLRDLAACLQYGRDVASVPSCKTLGHGLGAMDQALQVALVALRFRESDFAISTPIREALASLDREFPSLHGALDGEVTMLYADIVQSCSSGRSNPPPARRHCWKYGFSVPLAVASLYERAQRAVESARALESMEWKLVPGACADFEKEINADLWRISLHDLRRIEEIALYWRECRARLRLMLAAMQIRCGIAPGGSEWPQDPFTLQPLHFRKEAGRFVVWSEWKDGDNRGIGEWRPRSGGKDVILEVPE